MDTRFTVVLACAITGAALTSPTWAINKCTQPDGSFAFQDAPCAGKGEALTVKPAAGAATAVSVSDGAAKARADLAAVSWRLKVRESIEMRRPMVGMSRSELDQAMGPPDRANLANYQGIPHDQLIYERGGRTLYVYTDAGIVKSIQNTEAVGSARQPARCPSGHEIRSMETSASSITLSEDERVERLRQIGEARKCSR